MFFFNFFGSIFFELSMRVIRIYPLGQSVNYVTIRCSSFKVIKISTQISRSKHSCLNNINAKIVAKNRHHKIVTKIDTQISDTQKSTHKNRCKNRCQKSLQKSTQKIVTKMVVKTVAKNNNMSGYCMLLYNYAVYLRAVACVCVCVCGFQFLNTPNTPNAVT